MKSTHFISILGAYLILVMLSFLRISTTWLFPLLGLFGLGILALVFFKLNELHTLLSDIQDLAKQISGLKKEVNAHDTRLQILEELTLPKQLENYSQTADQLWRDGQLRGARNICQKGVELFPRAKELIVKLSQIVEGMGSYQEAAEVLKKAEVLTPKDSDLVFHLGNLWFRAGNYQEAISAYDKALILGSESVDIYLNKGEALVQLGKLAEAMAWYSRGIEKYPNHMELRSNRAEVYLELGENSACLKETNQILEEKPDFAAAHYNKACCLAKLGETSYAKQELLTAIQRDYSLLEKVKQDPDLREIQGEVCRAEAVIEKGDEVTPVKIEARMYRE
ncbi:MAG TPA: tetratricopeptide repeat protein [Bacillota bacterium]|nr:tetratricopeptide repeat protein [Bacillota bacterium]